MAVASTKSGTPIALIVLGLIFLIFGAMKAYQNNKEARYYEIEGIVKTAEVKKLWDSLAGSKTSSVSWELLVTYEYKVDGQLYENNKISARVQKSDASFEKPPSEKILQLAERFKAGNSVPVYVSSKHPHRSILLHRSTSSLWFFVISGLLFALAFYLSRR